MRVLKQYPEFRAFRTARSSGGTAEDSAEEVVTAHGKDTPETTLENVYKQIQESLSIQN